MPRRKRMDKRRHELTLEVRALLVNMRGYDELDAPRELWQNFWRGPSEARAAFEALRGKTVMHAKDGQSYEQWLATFLREPEGEDDGDHEPDNKETD